MELHRRGMGKKIGRVAGELPCEKIVVASIVLNVRDFLGNENEKAGLQAGDEPAIRRFADETPCRGGA